MNKTPGNYNISREKDPTEIVRILDEKIYEFNVARTMRNDGSMFAYTVRDTDTAIIAGVTGWTWAGACEITLFWIDESWRRLGLGARMLEAAELEAKGNGCSKILVRSYSFQAPFFYEKNGYTVKHILDDFPPGHKSYLLVKEL